MKKIVKIILYDDEHSASAWRIIQSHVQVPVEHNLIDRVTPSKSLVDVRLTAGTCREFYQNQVDSFILMSSDSDYWGLISSLPDARFLVMVEKEKCGSSIKAAMNKAGIFYCYLDNFYSGNCSDLQSNALIREVYRYLNNALNINVHAMMEQAYRSTRVVISESEKQRFYQKYIKPMHLVIEEDGTVRIQLQSR